MWTRWLCGWCVAMTAACGGSEAVPPGDARALPGAGAGFSLDTQTVGAPTDGLALRSIRHAPHPGYHRIVFDIGLAEGQPARAVPHARASYRARDRSIELTIDGVRHDLTGNLPLHGEGGQPLGKPIPIGQAPVDRVSRELSLDDQQVAYRVHLTREARFFLQGLPDPSRIVLDVENTGGATPAAP